MSFSLKKFFITKWNTFKISAHRERKETIHAIKLIGGYTRGNSISKIERNFIILQLKDVGKVLILIILSILPIPLPLTAIAILVGKLIGVNLLPSSHVNTKLDIDDEI